MIGQSIKRLLGRFGHDDKLLVPMRHILDLLLPTMQAGARPPTGWLTDAFLGQGNALPLSCMKRFLQAVMDLIEESHAGGGDDSKAKRSDWRHQFLLDELMLAAQTPMVVRSEELRTMVEQRALSLGRAAYPVDWKTKLKTLHQQH
jgi:hypothetical protein